MRWTLMDFAAVVVLIVVLCMTTTLTRHSADSVAMRIKCASNLRQIGQAIQLYANENKGAYPRTTFDRNTADKPTWGAPYSTNPKLGPGPSTADPFEKPRMADELKPFVVPANDVTAALYLLLRNEDITSDVFVCPSSHRKPWDFGGGQNTALNWTNWKGVEGLRDHLSYSYQDPYPTEAAIAKGWKLNTALPVEYAIAADMNPGSDILTKLTTQSNPKDLREGNTFNHNGDGQNVLYADFHVVFEPSPLVGMQQDNIYTAGGADAKAQQIVGAPVGPEDTNLLPTAKDIGVTAAMLHPVAAKPFTAQEKQAAQEKLVGTYSRTEGKQKVRLTIDDKQIQATRGPVSITYQYAITGQDDSGAIVVDLTAPDTKPSPASINAQKPGVIEFSDTDFFDGEWKSDKAAK